jgi:hypothetical protein
VLTRQDFIQPSKRASLTVTPPMPLNFSIELQILAMIIPTPEDVARLSSSPLTPDRSEAG